MTPSLPQAVLFMNIKGQDHLLSFCPECLRFSVFIFLSFKTAGLVEAKLHVEQMFDEGMKVCSLDLGHMIKRATMPIYDKKHLKIFLGKEWPMILKLDMHHLVLHFYKTYSNGDPWLTLTYLGQGQIWSLRLLYGKKAKLWIM